MCSKLIPILPYPMWQRSAFREALGRRLPRYARLFASLAALVGALAATFRPLSSPSRSRSVFVKHRVQAAP